MRFFNTINMKKIILKILSGILLIGVVYALICFLLIGSKVNEQPSDNAVNNFLVLGSEIKGADLEHSYPSESLKDRLDATLYLASLNSKAKIIVSGGKIGSRKVGEAEGMAKYLVDHGISKNRIIEENKAQNTYQNLKFSKKWLTGDTMIVTSDFHLYRSLYLAKELGYHEDELSGYAVKSKHLYTHYPREILAVGETLIFGGQFDFKF